MDKSKLLGSLSEEFIAELHALVVEDMALDQMAMLRRLHGITIGTVTQTFSPDGTKFVYIVHGSLGERHDVGTGAADLTGLGGPDWANALKAAETQAKRRLTTSLIGYGFAPQEESKAAAEPAKPEEPIVNHAPATVDPTPALQSLSTEKALELAATLLPTLATIPQVSEETLAKMHRTSQKDDKPLSDPTAAPKEKHVAPPTPEAPSIFDEIVPDAAATFHPTDPKDVPATPSTTEALQPATESALSTGEPEIVKDLEVPPATSEKPTRLQFQAFTARCTKLCRDVLPKAGKEVAQTLLPYLRKVFNVQDLSQATCLQWESTLARLEGAKTPAEAAAIIKSGK